MQICLAILFAIVLRRTGFIFIAETGFFYSVCCATQTVRSRNKAGSILKVAAKALKPMRLQ